MIPAASAAGAAVKPLQPATSTIAARTAQPLAPETARASTGETSASNIRLDTDKAVTAPEQSATAPRLRDQETAERSNRTPPSKDAPTGPPPAFEESPLERQARVAFDPPEFQPDPAFDLVPGVSVEKDEAGAYSDDTAEVAAGKSPLDPPPTPSERAEAGFTATRALAITREPATLDVEL